MVSNIFSHSIKMDNSIKLSKINFTTLKLLLFFFRFSFLSFILFSKPFLISFQKHFNHFDFPIKTTQPIKLNAIACMHQTCCYLIMYFNLMKIFYFPIFHVHKSSLVNHFSSISQRGKF